MEIYYVWSQVYLQVHGRVLVHPNDSLSSTTLYVQIIGIVPRVFNLPWLLSAAEKNRAVAPQSTPKGDFLAGEEAREDPRDQ